MRARGAGPGPFVARCAAGLPGSRRRGGPRPLAGLCGRVRPVGASVQDASAGEGARGGWWRGQRTVRCPAGVPAPRHRAGHVPCPPGVAVVPRRPRLCRRLLLQADRLDGAPARPPPLASCRRPAARALSLAASHPSTVGERDTGTAGTPRGSLRPPPDRTPARKGPGGGQPQVGRIAWSRNSPPQCGPELGGWCGGAGRAGTPRAVRLHRSATSAGRVRRWRGGPRARRSLLSCVPGPLSLPGAFLDQLFAAGPSRDPDSTVPGGGGGALSP